VVVVEVADVGATATAGEALAGAELAAAGAGLAGIELGPLSSDPAPPPPPESDDVVDVVVDPAFGAEGGPPTRAMILRAASAALEPSATGPTAIPISTPDASMPVASTALRR
jgi:hypothetical protein